MRHDRLKYDRYFNLLREIIGDTIVSPDGTKVIHVTVEATTAIVEGADVWDERRACCSSGKRAVQWLCWQRRNSGRFGAFEVHDSDLPAVTSVPRVESVSKPDKALAKCAEHCGKCKALLQPAFQQWADDEELQAKMLDLTEQADELLDEYGGEPPRLC